MYNKLNLSIAEFCHKEKEEISGVLFKKDRTVATDKYVLIEVETPKIKEDDFPILPNTETEEMKNDCIIPIKAVNKMLANIPKSATLPILENVVFCKGTDEQAEFATTDLEQVDKVSVRTIQDKYPDYEQIIPTEKVVKKIKFNVKQLQKILRFYSKNDKEMIEFEIRENTEMMQVNEKFGDQNVRIFIMQCPNK